MKELPIIVKADVQGSAEVLADTLTKLSDDSVKIRIIHSGVGAINESDVLLASASNAIVIGFNVRPDRNAADVADRDKVDIRLHSVIYNVIDEMKKAMTGLLEPTLKEVRIGVAEVRDTFKVPKVGTIAGCMVTEGASRAPATRRRACCATTSSSTKARSARCAASRTTSREVKAGFECGIGFEKFNDIKVGDVIEAFAVERVAATASGVANGHGTRPLSARSRPDRVGRSIRDELSTLLAREVHDPGIGFITLTTVKVSPDLQLARVYYTSMGDDKALRTRRRRSAAPRRSCGGRSAQRLRLRRAPELQFFYDQSIAPPGPHRADPAGPQGRGRRPST